MSRVGFWSLQGMDSSAFFFRLSVNWLGVSLGMLCSSMEEDEGKEALCLSRREGPYLLVLGCSQNLVRKEVKGFDQISHFMQKKIKKNVVVCFPNSLLLLSYAHSQSLRGHFFGEDRSVL